MNQSIEKTALSNLISNEDYARKVIPFLKGDYFKVREERIVFEEIQKFIDKYKCICVHPSPLPKYRGGCPLQHQIIDGVEKSAISIFVMDDKLDHGPILSQTSLNLTGELKDVLSRLTTRTSHELSEVIERLEREPDWMGVPQDHSQATLYKRRTPSESEINIEDFGNYTAKELYNKIRALQDPYPNSYITCKDGTKLYLTQAKHD